MTHQFEIFKSGEIKGPAIKKIITPERLREVQALMKSGRDKDAVKALRDIRYQLENFERSFKVAPKKRAISHS